MSYYFLSFKIFDQSNFLSEKQVEREKLKKMTSQQQQHEQVRDKTLGCIGEDPRVCKCHCAGNKSCQSACTFSVKAQKIILVTATSLCLMIVGVSVFGITSSDAELNNRVKQQEPELKKVYKIVETCEIAISSLNNLDFCINTQVDYSYWARSIAKYDPGCQDENMQETLEKIWSCKIVKIDINRPGPIWVISVVFCAMASGGVITFLFLLVLRAKQDKFDEKSRSRSQSQSQEEENDEEEEMTKMLRVSSHSDHQTSSAPLNYL